MDHGRDLLGAGKVIYTVYWSYNYIIYDCNLFIVASFDDQAAEIFKIVVKNESGAAGDSE